jgi:hypothetical protein
MAIKPVNQVAENIETSSDAHEEKAQATEQAEATKQPEAAAAAEAPVEKAEAQVEDRAAESASVLEEEPAAEEPKEQPAQPSTSTAITQATTSTGVAPSSRVQGAFLAQIMEDLREEGFEGTELDYSSFLNITLNKQIETSEGQELPNTGFLVRLASSRTKYCFRNNNPVEDEVEVAYSYDRDAHKDPESQVAKKIAEWKEQGLDLGDVKEYVEVLAVMLDDKVEGDAAGELNGKLITVQVAPTSKGRWAGYVAQLKMAGVKNVSDVKTLVRRGKKVESGKFPFYPWDFVNKGEIEQPAE